MIDWVSILDEAEDDLLQAVQAREQGNEGKARVCARRAAGKALNIPMKTSHNNALEVLQFAAGNPEVPAEVQGAIQRLTQRVDAQYNLPQGWDLLADARQIIAVVRRDCQSGGGKMEKQIVLYGATWCGDTRRARKLLDQYEIPYKWVDIDQDEEARKYVEKVNNGFRSVPTIDFPDGSRMVEPSTQELKTKLGINE